MVDTLQQTLRPLCFMCFIMGLGFYLRKQSKLQWISHLHILYSLIIWFAYTCLFLYMIFYFKRKVLFESAATEITEDSNLLLSITSVIMSFYHQKVFLVRQQSVKFKFLYYNQSLFFKFFKCLLL